ncbi:hypothetical protein M569_15597 [Genlisea aurea]|uniref:CCHC-type domain-containing protein n=1 Tax=Genlisea aurea TaxID=192259 RepID=S8D925_9LAMI|nr:hypothetical protein M569_15597 [Genlisea aurea]
MKLSDLLASAVMVESDIRAQEEFSRKRGSTGEFKGKQVIDTKVVSSTAYKGIPPCKTCGRLHLGECRAASGGCYNCGEKEHIARECPKPRRMTVIGGSGGSQTNKGLPRAERTNARVFNLTKENVNQDATAITGTFQIESCDVIVLFDCGASHSFISCSCAGKLNLKGEKPYVEIRVKVPGGNCLHTGMVHNGVLIQMGEFQTIENLYEIEIGEFDVILGLDWLSRYSARIGCRNKTVELCDENGNWWEYETSTGRCNPHPERMSGNVRYILVSNIELITKHDTGRVAAVLEEYKDVFPEELPGDMPPRDRIRN